MFYVTFLFFGSSFLTDLLVSKTEQKYVSLVANFGEKILTMDFRHVNIALFLLHYTNDL